MGKIPYALSILTALGFVENEGGSLALVPGSSFQNLEGRRLELEVGLEMLRKRIKSETANNMSRACFFILIFQQQRAAG